MKTCLMVIFTFALMWDILKLSFVKANQLSLKYSFKDYELSFKSMSKENQKEKFEEYKRLKQNTEKNIKDGKKFVHSIKKTMFFDSTMILIVLLF